MASSRNITYARHSEGYVYSRVGNEVAFPVLEFAEIGMGGLERSTGIQYEPGDFHGPTNYHLEKCGVHEITTDWKNLTWMKKVPLFDKNEHRQFWGLKPLKPILPNDREIAVRNSLPSDFDRCVYDIKNGLNGQPHLYTWQQISKYLSVEPGAVKTALRLIKERM